MNVGDYFGGQTVEGIPVDDRLVAGYCVNSKDSKTLHIEQALSTPLYNGHKFLQMRKKKKKKNLKKKNK